MKSKDFSIRSRKNRKGSLRTVTMEGELSLKNALPIWQKLSAVRRDAEQYELVLDQVGNLDLSIVQQLYAFKRQLEKEGCSCSFRADLADDLHAMMKTAGFSELITA